MAKITSHQSTTVKTKKDKVSKQYTGVGENTILKLILPTQEVEQTYQKILRRFAQQVKIPGFRPGKAPLKKVEEQVGRDKIVNQVLNQLLPSAFDELIKKKKKHPLTSPEIKILSTDQGKDWEVEIIIAEKPTIKLGKYQAAVKKALKEAEKEIAKQEKELAKKATELKKQNQQAKLEIKNPAHKEKLSDQEKENLRLKKIFEHLVSSIKPLIPELLIKEEVRRQLDGLSQQLKQYRLSWEDYLQKMHLSFEQLTGQMAVTALTSLQVEFILEAIISEQKMTVNEEDYATYLKKINSDKKAADLDDHIKSHLRHTILRRRVLDFLLNLK